MAQLRVNFTASKTGGCSPVAVLFTNTSTGVTANAVYTWDFGNGNTATTANAGALYKDERNYTVTLTVQDGAQTTATTQVISVYAKPVVTDIAVSTAKGCLPLNTVFTATAAAGSGNIGSYLWDFGDGNTQQSYAGSQSHTYTVPQKASASVTVTNNFGCSSTFQKNDMVEVLPSIGAVFGASQTILCRETDAVQFTNNSYGPGILSYVWDFGDGTSSTVKAPAHSFNKKGIYTVKLTVSSTEGCVISNTQAGYINVASFTTDFTGPSLLCKGSTLTFNSASTPGASNFTWEVDGTPASYYYNSLYYTFNTPGNHTIKLKNTIGVCQDSVIKTLSVKEIPYPNGFISNILTNCGAPVTVNFTDTTANVVKWEWSFDPNYYYNAIDAVTRGSSYTYSHDGGYNVLLKVINADGCSAYTSKAISVRSPAVSITTDGNGISCGPVTLTFTANASEEIAAYYWKFSDGSVSTETKPTHLFSTAGMYNVILNYTTKSGCTGSVSYGNIRVYGTPVADFVVSSNTTCGNQPLTFKANDQGNDYLSYYWYLGDNTYPLQAFNSPVITHQYSKDSLYTVMLIVANDGNCRDTMTKKDYIKVLPPFPKITGATYTCDGTRGLVTFTQASKKAETWTWDFGDGTITALTAEQPAITHTYARTGNYNVVLSTTNGQCTVTDAITAPVLLKQKPVFSAPETALCLNQPFPFDIKNIETNPYPNIYWGSYNFVKWQNEDGSNFQGYYNTSFSGLYWTSNVSGTASSYSPDATMVRAIFQSAGFGCNDTTNYITLTFKNALAGFEVLADKQCWQQPVVFSDTSKAVGSNQLISRDWNFGDGTTQRFTVGGTVSHRYNNPGRYQVSLQVRDLSGCNNSILATQYVEVNGPKAAFNASSATTTITLPVYFYNNTSNYNSYNTQYQWDFGDGTTSTTFSPAHTYNSAGDYSVRLVATGPDSGCRDTAYQVIKVQNFKPAFSFNSSLVTGSCPPVLVMFSNNSVNYTSVKWDFGDGVTADNLTYPSHVYEKPGKYIVTLYVYGVSGLKATYTDSILINIPMAVLHTDTTEICKGGSVNFITTSKNSAAYLWDFGDGNVVATGATTAAHVYNIPGLYKTAVMVTDEKGCTALTELNEKINVHPSPHINFSPAQPVVCKGSSTQVKATGGNVYNWSPATGLSDPAIAAPYISPAANTNYTVTVKDNIGCSASAAIQVTVAPPFTLRAPPDTSVCLGRSVPLPVSGADSYLWINNISGLSNAQSPAPFAAPLVATTYTVTGKDKYNCFADTAHMTVSVLALPSVYAGEDVEVLGAAPVQLAAVSNNDIVQWNWSPATYLNCANCSNPISTPLAQTAYTVTVKDKNGCLAGDTILIKLLCDQDKVRIPNAFTPNHDNSNDVFMIKGISLVKHLVIFDRWGAKVFERSNFIAGDYSSCWDGMYKGNPATVGTYVYFAEMQCPSGGMFVMKGSVMLLR